jgi:hypothetical protein
VHYQQRDAAGVEGEEHWILRIAKRGKMQHGSRSLRDSKRLYVEEDLKGQHVARRLGVSEKIHSAEEERGSRRMEPSTAMGDTVLKNRHGLHPLRRFMATRARNPQKDPKPAGTLDHPHP